ncbi:MAG: type II toxin-antitoxin system HicB family antitoxin [Thermomicrobiales bacterium]
MIRYTVVLDPEPDGSAYTVTVPVLPGCVTWGETIDEALANAREAIRVHVRGLAKAGDPVPVESPDLIVTGVEVKAPIGELAPA